MQVEVSVRKVSRVLLSIVLGLISVHSLLQFFVWQANLNLVRALPDKFNLDTESSIPTWFGEVLLLLAATLLAVIAVHEARPKARFRRHWAVLSGVFFCLSIDEGASLHEVLSRPLRSLLGLQDQTGTTTNAWVTLALPLVVLFGVMMWRFVFSLPKETKLRFITSGILYLSGVFLVELVGPQFSGYQYVLATTVEESLEMFGVLLFIRALLLYIADWGRTVELTVTE